MRESQDQHRNGIENEGEAGQGELRANVPGKHGINPPQDSRAHGRASPQFNGLEEGVGLLTSIQQEEDGQNRDGEEPNRAGGDIPYGRGTALENPDDKIMMTSQ